MNISIVGIDLAKNVFQVCALSIDGAIDLVIPPFLVGWASPEIPDTEIRCKDGLGGVGWVLEGCSLGSSSSRR